MEKCLDINQFYHKDLNELKNMGLLKPLNLYAKSKLLFDKFLIQNFDVNAEIMDFIDKILPKEEMKTYLLKLFASFLSGHIKDEKFHIFTGTGANGKSKIIELFQ